EFTICCDTEKGCIRVWGLSIHGYVEYHLCAGKRGGIQIWLDRASSDGIYIIAGKEKHRLLRKESIVFLTDPQNFIPFSIPYIDRLSLGSNKKMDWELVNRRNNLTEILPFWHRVGQCIPLLSSDENGGVLNLLEECKRSQGIEAEKKW